MDTESYSNPFPGLRSFEPEEDYLFFGREKQIDELLKRLRNNRFLAVIGASGCGKSSLIKAGLIPSLHGGLMSTAGSHWRVAIMRPGGDPIGRLAEALNAPDVLDSSECGTDTGKLITDTVLRSSALGLVQFVRQAALPAQDNLLILIDQFEELFRFKASRQHPGARDEAIAFVKLLLETARDQTVPIYIVLTMRSDFIGNCMEFQELPEAINASQYLVPRLNRDELRQAITGPVAVGGGEIAQRLVIRLLNDLGDNQDQLPVLQHTLMRVWGHWQRYSDTGQPLDLAEYEAIGTLREALSRHADKAYQELSKKQQRIAEIMFKALTDKDPEGKSIRRLVPVSDICALTGATSDQLISVIDAFRRRERSFLMPPEEYELTAASAIDISHESLMRLWDRLVIWQQEEQLAADRYQRLLDAAQRHEAGEESLLQDPMLQLYLQWWRTFKPTDLWAERYGGDFKLARYYLYASRQRRERKRWLITAMAVIFVAMLGSMGYIQYRNNQQAKQTAFAQKLGVEALLSRDRDPERATLLAIEAIRAAPQKVTASVPAAEEVLKGPFVIPSGEPLLGSRNYVRTAVFSPDAGRLLATVGGDGNIIFWNTASHVIEHTIRSGSDAQFTAATFSADGRWLAAGDNKGVSWLWDLRQHQTDSAGLLPTLDPALASRFPNFEVYINALVFNRQGSLLAVADTKGVTRLWKTTAAGADAKPLTSIYAESETPVNALAFNPAGTWLAMARADSIVQLRQVDGPEPVSVELSFEDPNAPVKAVSSGSKPAINTVLFSPDGHWLAAGGADGSVRLWNFDRLIKNGRLRAGASLRQDIKLRGSAFVNALAFITAKNSSQADWMVTAGANGFVQLWNFQKVTNDLQDHPEAPERVVLGHDLPINAVAFNTASSLLVTASADASIRLWKLTFGTIPDTAGGSARGTRRQTMIDLGCSAVSRNLSDAEWSEYMDDLSRHQTCRLP